MEWAFKLNGAVAAAETLDLKVHTPKGTEGHGSKSYEALNRYFDRNSCSTDTT
jgi:hypothetical protein